MPMRITTVADDSAAWRMSSEGFPSQVYPVVTQILSYIQRFVRGMRCAAAMPVKDAITGTRFAEIPCRSAY